METIVGVQIKMKDISITYIAQIMSSGKVMLDIYTPVNMEG